ncbi:MAG: adenylate/guanylate cyclase domain-containing protein [Dehalococcoidia bacterium]
MGLSSTALAMGEVGFVGRIASRRTVINFDFPGTGLSVEGPADMSQSAQVSYMEAVARELGEAPIDVYAWGPSAAPAAAFAARCPSAVSKLVLANPCVDFRVMEANSPLVKVLELASADFGLFATTLMSLLGVPLALQTKLHETLLLSTPETVRPQWLRAVSEFNASDDLASIFAPTLVLQARNNPIVSPQHVTSVAGKIPHARLAMVDSAPLGGMLDTTLDTVIDFLDGREDLVQNRPRQHRGSLKVIAFTDIENHSEMMQRLGDPAGRSVLREHERMTKDAIRRYGGTIVKSQGDGFMACFDSAQAALDWAADLQKVFAERPGEPLKIRIGLNAGEPVSEDDDFFGTSVIAAARVAAQARGGQVLLSNVVRELAHGKGFLFSDRGEEILRGLEEPVHLFELNWTHVSN